MSQILKLKRGSLERLSTITGSLQKGEVIFASASIGIPSSNGSGISNTYYSSLCIVYWDGTNLFVY